MPTTLIRSQYNIPTAAQGGVVTIGNFDGVHLGHQQLIQRVIEEAKKRRVPSVVITFEPHPFEFFEKGEHKIPRITRLREKFRALEECGIDYVLILPFNQKLASLSASDFVASILYQQLGPVHIIIGDDFKFGHKRLGDFALLNEMGKMLGFSVASMPTLLIDGERVSSTRVRQALMAGDHVTAKNLLGHSYTMLGRVRPGDQLGRKLGFPTANIFLHRRLTPVRGIYTVYMHGIASHPLPGVANVGTRPTVDGTRTLLEVHLLDFDQDIYGRYIKVEFCEKLRDEVRFDTLALLQEQIEKDVVLARARFMKNEGRL
jgi:riboflavin kinase/FMN adenylyltransferase